MTLNSQHAAAARHSAIAKRKAPGDRISLLIGALALTSAIHAPAPARADTTWYGTNTTDWFTGVNWQNGVPVATKDVYISAGDVMRQPIIDGATGVGRSIFIGTGGPGSGPNEGRLLIRNGGRLDTGQSAFMGHSAGVDSGFGQVTVTGAGSQWNANSGTIFVGQSFDAALNIIDGGAVTSSYGTLGFGANSTGTVGIEGAGSVWTVLNELRIGRQGVGVLSLSSGGRLGSATGELGLLTGSSGTATVTGAGTVWSIANALNVGFSGAGTLTVGDGGTVEVVSGLGEATVATITGSSGTINIGAAETDPAAGAGTLTVPRIVFGGGNGRLVFNHTDTGYGFTPDLEGAGAVLHAAGETIYTGDGLAFSGASRVTGGRLLVNGALLGTTDVDGGTLGGTGRLDVVNINGNGTIAPGNSIGTLNIGVATFNPGSTYEVELNDGGNTPGVNNDLLAATDLVTINGGTIHVKPENGTDSGASYAPGTTYTVITSSILNGRFDRVTDAFPLLRFSDTYDAQNVYLTSQVAATCPGGMTFNQTNTCGGVLSVGSGNMHDAVINLSHAELPDALDLLSGEIHVSVPVMLLDDSHQARAAVTERLRDNLPLETHEKPEVVSSSGQRGLPALFEDQAPLSPWTHIYGSLANWQGDGNAATLRRASGGVFLGLDQMVTEALTLGVLAGYSQTGFSVNARNSAGMAQSWHLGVYGGGEWDGFALRGGLVRSWHQIQTSRDVNFRGFTDSLAAAYAACTTQVFAEASYSFDAEGITFEPYAGLAYVRHSTNAFSETGGLAALTSAQSRTSNTYATLGLRAQTDVDLGGDMPVRLTGGIGWRHTFGPAAPNASMTFAGGTPFDVAGVPLGRDALMLDFGADIALGDTATLSASYAGEFAARASDHSLKMNLSFSF